MQLIAGYSADSAANLLRQDPVFKAVLDRKELAFNLHFPDFRSTI